MKSSIPTFLPEVLLLSAVVFGPLAFGATEPWSIAVLECLLFSVAIFSVAGGCPHGGRSAFPVLMSGIAVILAIGLLQYCNPRSSTAPAPLTPFTVTREGTGHALVLWSSYVALLIGSSRVLGTRAAVRRFMSTIFILGALIAVVGLMQRGQGNTAYYGLRPVRHGNPFGPYTNYDHAASMLVLALFAGAGIFGSRFDAIRRTEQTGKIIEAWFLQAMVGFLMAVIIYALILIRSRGAIHAMSASMMILAALALCGFASRKQRLVGGAILISVFSAYGVFMVRHKAMLGLEDRSPMAAFRLTLYRNSLEIARDFPTFGTGLASYAVEYPIYQDRPAIRGFFDHAHNDWIELLIQTGWIGLASFAGSLCAAFIAATRGWLTIRSSEARWMAGACLAAVLSFVLHGFVDFSFQTPANAVLFLVLLVSATSITSEVSQ